MVLIWAVVTGVIFSYIFKNGFFFIIGLFVGSALYETFIKARSSSRSSPDPILFLTISFEVLGHLSKAKGKVTQNDIDIALGFMNKLQLNSEKRKLAQNSFNRGKLANYPLQERLNELYLKYRSSKRVLDVFCQQLIQAAISDGILHKEEEQILYTVAKTFHISHNKMALYIEMILASYQFKRDQQQYQKQGYSQNNYQYGTDRSGHNIHNAYRILGVDSSADATTIKRAYRKLMNEHHPDKLVSKGLPKEMLESAKKRVQEIQSAYDAIKTYKGFK